MLLFCLFFPIIMNPINFTFLMLKKLLYIKQENYCIQRKLYKIKHIHLLSNNIYNKLV